MVITTTTSAVATTQTTTPTTTSLPDVSIIVTKPDCYHQCSTCGVMYYCVGTRQKCKLAFSNFKTKCILCINRYWVEKMISGSSGSEIIIITAYLNGQDKKLLQNIQSKQNKALEEKDKEQRTYNGL